MAPLGKRLIWLFGCGTFAVEPSVWRAPAPASPSETRPAEGAELTRPYHSESARPLLDILPSTRMLATIVHGKRLAGSAR